MRRIINDLLKIITMLMFFCMCACSSLKEVSFNTNKDSITIGDEIKENGKL